MTRAELLDALAAVNTVFVSLAAEPPYSLEVAEAFDDETLAAAVMASGRRLVYVQKVLDEQNGTRRPR